MKKKKNILCFGEVLWDNLPGGPKPGGAPMNVALHLSRFGLNVSMVSRVGNDQKGEKLKQFLEESGLNTRAIQTDPRLPTGEVLIHLDQHNNPTYEILEPAAWDNIEMSEQLIADSQSADMIIFGSLAARNTLTRKTLHKVLENAGFKVMDINLRPPYDTKVIVEQLLHKADMIKLNEHELHTVVNEWNSKELHHEDEKVRWLAKYFGCDQVCVTKGENGALLYHEGIIDRHPGFRIKTVDNVGAGDAFLSGLIDQYLQGTAGPKALEFACATGALVASRTGATPNYEPEEVQRIIYDQKN